MVKIVFQKNRGTQNIRPSKNLTNPSFMVCFKNLTKNVFKTVSLGNSSPDSGILLPRFRGFRKKQFG